jgi:hypothetical protein
MKEKRDTIKEKKSARDHNSGLQEKEMQKEKEKETDEVKRIRHWARLAKRNFHPDGPGGSYEGL